VCCLVTPFIDWGADGSNFSFHWRSTCGRFFWLQNRRLMAFSDTRQGAEHLPMPRPHLLVPANGQNKRPNTNFWAPRNGAITKANKQHAMVHATYRNKSKWTQEGWTFGFRSVAGRNSEAKCLEECGESCTLIGRPDLAVQHQVGPGTIDCPMLARLGYQPNDEFLRSKVVPSLACRCGHRSRGVSPLAENTHARRVKAQDRQQSNKETSSQSARHPV